MDSSALTTVTGSTGNELNISTTNFNMTNATWAFITSTASTSTIINGKPSTVTLNLYPSASKTTASENKVTTTKLNESTGPTRLNTAIFIYLKH